MRFVQYVCMASYILVARLNSKREINIYQAKNGFIAIYYFSSGSRVPVTYYLWSQVKYGRVATTGINLSGVNVSWI